MLCSTGHTELPCRCPMGILSTGWIKRTPCVHVQLLSRVQLFATPWTVALQAPLSIGFSRQEYWSGLPFPSPEDLPDSGIESLAWQASSLPLAPSEKPLYQAKCLQNVQVTVLEMEAIWETVLIWSAVSKNAPLTREVSSGTRTKGLPGGPVAETLHSQCRGAGFNPCSGN